MSREIKFRAWHEGYPGKLIPGQMLYDEKPGDCLVAHNQGQPVHIMQFTGLKDKNGKEIYEGDIFRVEEDGAEDGTDQIYYLVIVWVKEWCMFCTLRLSDEYPAYLENGLKALDEPMFWTYTLEDTNDRRFYLCGNIYEHSHLLKDGE